MNRLGISILLLAFLFDGGIFQKLHAQTDESTYV